MSLILIERFPQDALAQELQAYLSAAPTDNSQSFLYHEEFLWYNPGQAATTPTPLTHLAPGTGTIFMRSGWPDGACLLYTSDAADERSSVDLGGRRIIKKKKKENTKKKKKKKNTISSDRKE